MIIRVLRNYVVLVASKLTYKPLCSDWLMIGLTYCEGRNFVRWFLTVNTCIAVWVGCIWSYIKWKRVCRYLAATGLTYRERRYVVGQWLSMNEGIREVTSKEGRSTGSSQAKRKTQTVYLCCNVLGFTCTAYRYFYTFKW